MRVLVRSITFGCVVIAAAGCYAAHEHDRPARDGGPRDAPSHDAPPPDAPVDPTLPSCTRPIAEWRETSEVYPGRYTEGAARLYYEDATWIAAHREDGAVEVLRFDTAFGARPTPALEDVVPLDAPIGAPIAAGRDATRMAILGRGGDGTPHLAIFDAGGGPPLGEADFVSERAVARATVAVRTTRVGVAFDHPIPALHLVDASGGAILRSDVVMGDSGAIGLGRGLFEVVTGFVGGTGALWGFDDLGLVSAADLPEAMLRVEWDESTAAGVASDDRILVRRPGMEIEDLGVAERGISFGPSIAARGTRLWIATAASDGTLSFRDGEGFVRERAELEGADVLAVMAHDSRHHRGAFVLSASRSAIVWIGWACDPDR